MNLDTLKQHEKTFQKFVEWMKKNNLDYLRENIAFVKQDVYGANYLIHDRELLSLLVEFCDSEGYYIQPNCFPQFKAWNVSIMSGNINVCQILRAESGRFQDYDSRTEATQAAIKKCFELMEEWK